MILQHHYQARNLTIWISLSALKPFPYIVMLHGVYHFKDRGTY